LLSPTLVPPFSTPLSPAWFLSSSDLSCVLIQQTAVNLSSPPAEVVAYLKALYQYSPRHSDHELLQLG
jgi:hypothetical protein